LIASLNDEQFTANNISPAIGNGINAIWIVKNIAFYLKKNNPAIPFFWIKIMHFKILGH
jgi:hypothetical protein